MKHGNNQSLLNLLIPECYQNIEDNNSVLAWKKWYWADMKFSFNQGPELCTKIDQ